MCDVRKYRLRSFSMVLHALCTAGLLVAFMWGMIEDHGQPLTWHDGALAAAWALSHASMMAHLIGSPIDHDTVSTERTNHA